MASKKISELFNNLHFIKNKITEFEENITVFNRMKQDIEKEIKTLYYNCEHDSVKIFSEGTRDNNEYELKCTKCQIKYN